MHKITIPENSSSNCYDSIVYSLLKYHGFDHEAYNIKYFYTDYLSPSENIAYGIYRGKSHVNILKDIYGVDLVFKDRSEPENIFETISELLPDRPVGIKISPYHCFWSPFYRKAHYTHMLLVVGINSREKKYICFDVHHGSVGYVEVDFDTINQNHEKYFVFGFKEVKKTEPALAMEAIRCSLDNFDDNLDRKKAGMFDYFAKNDRGAIFPKNLDTSIPLINLTWIAEDKRHFPIALRYIESKIDSSVFTPIYDLLAVSGQKFLHLKTILIKYAISGVLGEDYLKKIIDQIFDTDALIVAQLRNIMGDVYK